MLSSAYPISFALENSLQQESLAVLYIVNKVSNAETAQQITLSFAQQDSQSYSFNGLQTVDSNNFHLALSFRKGVLLPEVANTLQANLQNALATAVGDDACLVSDVVVADDGSDNWYIAFKQQYTIAPDNNKKPWQLNLVLTGIAAQPGTGSRCSQVALLVNGLQLPGSSAGIAFQRSIHVDIVSHLGHSYAPLVFSVFGDNILHNNQTTPSGLSLYCEATDRSEVKIAANTKFIFSFNYGDVDTSGVEFGNKTQVSAYQPQNTVVASTGNIPIITPVPADNAEVPDIEAYNSLASEQQKQTLNAGQQVFTFAVTKLNNATDFVAINFPFKNILVSGLDGTVPLYIRVQNLPGYWDTTFQVPISKRSTVANSQIQIGKAAMPGDYGIGSRIDFLSSDIESDADYKTNFQANHHPQKVAIEEYWGLNLSGAPEQRGNAGARGVPSQTGINALAARPVKIRNADLLVPEGRLAIGGGYVGDNQLPEYPKPETGDVNSNEKLNVTGDSYFAGHIGITGDVGIAGKISVGFSDTGNTDNLRAHNANFATPYPSNGAIGVLIGDASQLGNYSSACAIVQPANNGEWPFAIITEKSLNFGIDTKANLVTIGQISCAKDIYTTEGSITAAKGAITGTSMTATQGDVTVSQGNITLAQGGITASKGAIEGASITACQGDITSNHGRVFDKMGEVMPVGSITQFYGTQAPKGWLFCDGNEIPSSCTELRALYDVSRRRLEQFKENPTQHIDLTLPKNVSGMVAMAYTEPMIVQSVEFSEMYTHISSYRTPNLNSDKPDSIEVAFMLKFIIKC